MKDKLFSRGFKETDAVICGWDQGSGTDKGGTWISPTVIFSIENKPLDIIIQSINDGSFYDLNKTEIRNRLMEGYIKASSYYFVNNKSARINSGDYKYKISQKVKIYYKEGRKVFDKQLYDVYMIEENEAVKEQYKIIQKRNSLLIKIFIGAFIGIALFLLIYIAMGGVN